MVLLQKLIVHKQHSGDTEIKRSKRNTQNNFGRKTFARIEQHFDLQIEAYRPIEILSNLKQILYCTKDTHTHTDLFLGHNSPPLTAQIQSRHHTTGFADISSPTPKPVEYLRNIVKLKDSIS